MGILFKMRRYKELIPLAELGMIDEPQDMQLRFILAVAYNTEGQYESAMHILRAMGLPELVFNGWRAQVEWDSLIALINSLYGYGDIEAAREMARFGLDFGIMEATYDWWWLVSDACMASVLAQDDKTRELLQQTLKGKRLPWDPVLQDYPCFDRFSDDPVYQAVVRHFDELRAELRERLPATLEEFGVEP
jgi:hypothetical protein